MDIPYTCSEDSNPLTNSSWNKSCNEDYYQTASDTANQCDEGHDESCKNFRISWAEPPVEIHQENTTDIDLPSLVWHGYDVTPKFLSVCNTGQTITLSGQWTNGKPYIEGGPLNGKYMFSQIHFHCPSEHEIDGRRFPLEMHVVHYKTSYLTQERAMHEKDGTLVLVYLFQVAEKDRTVLSEITKKSGSLEKISTRIEIDKIPLCTIMQPFCSNYYVYWGSVTMKKHSYILQWIINCNYSTVTKKEVDALLGIMSTAIVSKGPKMKPQNSIIYRVGEDYRLPSQTLAAGFNSGKHSAPLIGTESLCNQNQTLICPRTPPNSQPRQLQPCYNNYAGRSPSCLTQTIATGYPSHPTEIRYSHLPVVDSQPPACQPSQNQYVPQYQYQYQTQNYGDSSPPTCQPSSQFQYIPQYQCPPQAQNLCDTCGGIEAETVAPKHPCKCKPKVQNVCSSCGGSKSVDSWCKKKWNQCKSKCSLSKTSSCSSAESLKKCSRKKKCLKKKCQRKNSSGSSCSEKKSDTKQQKPILKVNLREKPCESEKKLCVQISAPKSCKPESEQQNELEVRHPKKCRCSRRKPREVESDEEECERSSEEEAEPEILFKLQSKISQPSCDTMCNVQNVNFPKEPNKNMYKLRCRTPPEPSEVRRGGRREVTDDPPCKIRRSVRRDVSRDSFCEERRSLRREASVDHLCEDRRSVRHEVCPDLPCEVRRSTTREMTPDLPCEDRRSEVSCDPLCEDRRSVRREVPPNSRCDVRRSTTREVTCESPYAVRSNARSEVSLEHPCEVRRSSTRGGTRQVSRDPSIEASRGVHYEELDDIPCERRRSGPREVCPESPCDILRGGRREVYDEPPCKIRSSVRREEFGDPCPEDRRSARCEEFGDPCPEDRRSARRDFTPDSQRDVRHSSRRDVSVEPPCEGRRSARREEFGGPCPEDRRSARREEFGGPCPEDRRSVRREEFGDPCPEDRRSVRREELGDPCPEDRRSVRREEFGGPCPEDRRNVRREEFGGPCPEDRRSVRREEFGDPCTEDRRSARREEFGDPCTEDRRNVRRDFTPDSQRDVRHSSRRDVSVEPPCEGRRNVRHDEFFDPTFEVRRGGRRDMSVEPPCEGRRSSRYEEFDDRTCDVRRNFRSEIPPDSPCEVRRNVRSEIPPDSPCEVRRNVRSEITPDLPCDVGQELPCETHDEISRRGSHQSRRRSRSDAEHKPVAENICEKECEAMCKIACNELKDSKEQRYEDCKEMRGDSSEDISIHSCTSCCSCSSRAKASHSENRRKMMFKRKKSKRKSKEKSPGSSSRRTSEEAQNKADKKNENKTPNENSTQTESLMEIESATKNRKRSGSESVVENDEKYEKEILNQSVNISEKEIVAKAGNKNEKEFVSKSINISEKESVTKNGMRSEKETITKTLNKSEKESTMTDNENKSERASTSNSEKKEKPEYETDNENEVNKDVGEQSETKQTKKSKKKSKVKMSKKSDKSLKSSPSSKSKKSKGKEDGQGKSSAKEKKSKKKKKKKGEKEDKENNNEDNKEEHNDSKNEVTTLFVKVPDPGKTQWNILLPPTNIDSYLSDSDAMASDERKDSEDEEPEQQECQVNDVTNKDPSTQSKPKELCFQMDHSFQSAKGSNPSKYICQEYNVTIMYDRNVLQEYRGIFQPGELSLGSCEKLNLVPKYQEPNDLKVHLQECVIKKQSLDKFLINSKFLLKGWETSDIFSSLRKAQQYGNPRVSLDAQTQYSPDEVELNSFPETVSKLVQTDLAYFSFGQKIKRILCKKLDLKPESEDPVKVENLKDFIKCKTTILQTASESDLSAKYKKPRPIRAFNLLEAKVCNSKNSNRSSIVNNSSEKLDCKIKLIKNSAKSLETYEDDSSSQFSQTKGNGKNNSDAPKKNTIYFMYDKIDKDPVSGKRIFMGRFRTKDDLKIMKVHKTNSKSDDASSLGSRMSNNSSWVGSQTTTPGGSSTGKCLRKFEDTSYDMTEFKYQNAKLIASVLKWFQEDGKNFEILADIMGIDKSNRPKSFGTPGERISRVTSANPIMKNKSTMCTSLSVISGDAQSRFNAENFKNTGSDGVIVVPVEAESWSKIEVVLIDHSNDKKPIKMSKKYIPRIFYQPEGVMRPGQVWD